ncbi:MAG: hypothetical protein E6240_13950 [Clostridium butyricum]|jgi:ASC-1-like (ASCH) protein|nr:hypothetical protein [Clostridium butyricum]
MNLEMNLSSKFFNMLEDGSKDIEIRLLDEKRSNLKVGDTIIFNNSNKHILTKVIDITYFDSFLDLLNSIPRKRIGLADSKELAINELSSIYPEEKLKKYKIIAIEIKKIST